MMHVEEFTVVGLRCRRKSGSLNPTPLVNSVGTDLHSSAQSISGRIRRIEGPVSQSTAQRGDSLFVNLVQRKLEIDG